MSSIPNSDHNDLLQNSPKQSPLKTAGSLGLLTAAILVAAGAWRLTVNQAAAENLKQRNAESLTRSVIAVHPRLGENSRKIQLPATLRGYTETQIHARTNGYLSAWYKTIGDKVKKGDLLAVIDVPELEEELAQAKASLAQIKVRLELADSTYKRWMKLKDTDSAIQQEYDEKRSAFHQAQADLAAAEVNVKRLEKLESYRRITAPFSGVITRRSAEIGNLITAGAQELFAMTQTDPLRVTVWVPQAYANDIGNGQEVAVKLTGSANSTLKARIEHVAGALDPVTRTRQADIILDNPDDKLLPGSYVEISLVVKTKTAPLLAPAIVLVLDRAGAHVALVTPENRIAFKQVTIGRDFGKELEILDGINEKDVLVASPSDLLVEGEKVIAAEPQSKVKG